VVALKVYNLSRISSIFASNILISWFLLTKEISEVKTTSLSIRKRSRFDLPSVQSIFFRAAIVDFISDIQKMSSITGVFAMWIFAFKDANSCVSFSNLNWVVLLHQLRVLGDAFNQFVFLLKCLFNCHVFFFVLEV